MSSIPLKVVNTVHHFGMFATVVFFTSNSFQLVNLSFPGSTIGVSLLEDCPHCESILRVLVFVGGFVLSMVNIFSKKVRPALVVAYAAFQGLFLGTITSFFETAYPGIASQAVLATLCAFGGMLFAYRSGRIRVTPKFQRVMFGALIGYLGLALVSIVASFMGTPGGLYNVSGLGLILAAGGVVLASLFIVMDLDQIDRSIKAGVPQVESWRAAFGLMVTLVWLYLEMLRLIAILRGDD